MIAQPELGAGDGAAELRWAAVASHQLRTTVAVLSGSLHTLLERWAELDDARRRNLIEAVAGRVDHLQRLTRDLLTLSTVREAPMPPAVEVPIAEVIARSLDQHGAVGSVAVEVDPELRVRVVPGHAEQILGILLDNACVHGAPPIAVTVSADADRVWVEVADRGAGIPSEQAERLFEPFVRGDPDSRTGTGLGLYIARELVRLNGGEITFAPARDGARVRVGLPRADGDPSPLE